MSETPNEQLPEPKWFIDEGLPGQGDRPTWLPEKFKTTADLAKSHIELEKRLGTVPDEYDLSKSKYIDPDYEPFQNLKKVAKEKRVSQDVLDTMLESFDKYMDEFSTDINEEIKKLGDDAQNRISIVDNWAKANLTKDSYEALRSNLRNADAFKALEELRGKVMSNAAQIPGNAGSVNTLATIDDLKMELSTNLEKYKTDKSYRDDLLRRMEVAVKNNTNYIDKVGG